jgi:hypothetical protein
MKKIIYILIFTLLSINGYAQMGEWTWMNGDSTANSLGHYGTQGVFDSLNTPPGLYEACEWTDKQGNFWLFGGVGYNQATCYSDLWEFNPLINQWAWIKGPGITDQVGVYGSQGIPSSTNNPGSRGWGVLSWVDTAGNLWLFGGLGYDINSTDGYLNDLWKYSIITNEWTWMKGLDTVNNTGIYGTRLISSSLNCPPSRCETSASWTDNTNCLWLFGGGFVGGGRSSDLWHYNISTNNWTWMKGADTANQPAFYGTKGVSDSTNTPGSRWCYAKWKDNNNDLWLFAGDGRNDLWRYSISLNQWTWMSGAINSDTASAGDLCISDTNNILSGRTENRACWTRECNNFVTFGGYGNSNDLWNYNVGNNEWTKMNGSVYTNSLGHYGSRTIPNSLNIPFGRIGSVGWKDNDGNLWLFGGGKSSGMYNDLWKFVPDTACPHIGCSRAGIQEISLNKNGINIFPNPNNGNFTVTCNLSNSKNELIIIDIMSRVVYEEILRNTNTEIDISKLSRGFYLVQIKTEKETFVKKLIIQ